MQFSQAIIVASGLAAAGVAFAQSTFTVNTPASLTQCRPYSIQWTGGTPPYFPSVTEAGNINSVLQSFGQTSDTSILWTVNQPAGTSVTISIGDSAGQVANSAESPAILSGDSSCLGSSASGSSSSAASSSSSATSSMSSSASSSMSSAASSSSSRAASSSSSASRSSSSAAAPTNTASNTNAAGSVRGYSAVVAGVVGVAAAALL